MIHLRLPLALCRQIEDLAKAKDRTENALIVEALIDYVRSESWSSGNIQKAIKEADFGEFASDHEVKSVFSKYGAPTP